MDHGLLKTLRLEGLAEAAVGLAAFGVTGESWWIFAAAVLAPDLGLLAYLANPRAGALVYNVLHSTIIPCVVAAAGFALGQSLLLAIAAAWLVHIGVDRALGYGLKSAAGFKHTHLGNLDTPCASR